MRHQELLKAGIAGAPIMLNARHMRLQSSSRSSMRRSSDKAVRWRHRAQLTQRAPRVRRAPHGAPWLVERHRQHADQIRTCSLVA
jgi:hypothetical protein